MPEPAVATEDPVAGETPPEAPPTPTEPPVDGDPPADDASKLKSALDKERQLRRDAEVKAKVNAEAATKLQEIEDANKTEVEKLTDKLARETSARQLAEAALTRATVAMRHGLTDEQARRLIGDSEDELEADALELLKMLQGEELEEEEAPNGAIAPAAPRPKLKSGSTPPAGLNEDKLLTDLKRKLGVK